MANRQTLWGDLTNPLGESVFVVDPLLQVEALEQEGVVEGHLLQVVVTAALAAVPGRVAHLEQHHALALALVGVAVRLLLACAARGQKYVSRCTSVGMGLGLGLGPKRGAEGIVVLCGASARWRARSLATYLAGLQKGTRLSSVDVVTSIDG